MNITEHLRNKRWVAVFPGQGSHAVGMGTAFAAHFPEAKAAFDEAEAEFSGLGALVAEGPLEELTLTANQQPALVTASVAAWRAWQAAGGGLPMAMAGHSLGEYSALVAAEAFTLGEAVRLTRARGLAMQEAVPSGQGGMLAMMGDAEAVEALCGSVEGASPANFNSPAQVVVSGTASAMAELAEKAREHKMRAIPLKVSAPFHSPLMAPAREKMLPLLTAAVWRAPLVPVYANVTAQPHAGPETLAGRLAEQITASVRWTQTVQTLHAAGAEAWVEFGPGTVLGGLIRKTIPGAETYGVSAPQDLQGEHA